MKSHIQTTPKVLVICGPTATGKSALAVSIAQQYGGEIISADSRQVYNELTIASGKILPNEMCGIAHHMINHVSLDTQFSVSDYVRDAHSIILDCITRGVLPIVCGGTGLYIDSLLTHTAFPTVEPNEERRKQREQQSCQELFSDLQQRDPHRARTIDRHNKRRLIRALEIIDTLGYVPTIDHSSQFSILRIGLSLPEHEYERTLRQRVQDRLDQGMIKEVKDLLVSGTDPDRLRSLGLEYRLLTDFCMGNIESEEKLCEMIYIKDRQYAKRQMTWFRRHKDTQWFTPHDHDAIKICIHQWLTNSRGES